MRKDITNPNRNAQAQANRSSDFFSSPWSEDFFEPTKWFDDFFTRDISPHVGHGRFLAPSIDIDETANEYIVSADLPGIKKEDISIECSGNQLTLSAERKCELQEGRKNERRERYYGSYQRSFTLPASADADKVEAEFEGGVLTLRIPKGEQAKSRKIEISETKTKNQEPTDITSIIDKH